MIASLAGFYHPGSQIYDLYDLIKKGLQEIVWAILRVNSAEDHTSISVVAWIGAEMEFPLSPSRSVRRCVRTQAVRVRSLYLKWLRKDASSLNLLLSGTRIGEGRALIQRRGQQVSDVD